MKEKKKNIVKRYELDMLEHAENMVGKMGIFSCIPKERPVEQTDPLNNDFCLLHSKIGI